VISINGRACSMVDQRRWQAQVRAMARDSRSLYVVAEIKSEAPANVSSEILVSLETGNYELEAFKTSVVARVVSRCPSPTYEWELRGTRGNWRKRKPRGDGKIPGIASRTVSSAHAETQSRRCCLFLPYRHRVSSARQLTHLQNC